MEANSRTVLPQDTLSSISSLLMLTVIPCLSGAFHCWTQWCLECLCVCEITLSCGQEVNSMCDNSQVRIQDSVSVLWTKAGGAELGLGGVEEAGLGRRSVA